MWQEQRPLARRQDGSPDDSDDDASDWPWDSYQSLLKPREAAIAAITVVRDRFGLRKPADLTASRASEIWDEHGRRKPSRAELAAETANPFSVEARAVTSAGKTVLVECEVLADGKTGIFVRSNLRDAGWDVLVRAVRTAVPDRSAP